MGVLAPATLAAVLEFCAEENPDKNRGSGKNRRKSCRSLLKVDSLRIDSSAGLRGEASPAECSGYRQGAQMATGQVLAKAHCTSGEFGNALVQYGCMFDMS